MHEPPSPRRPPTPTISPGSPLNDFSEAEIALLYADRLIPSEPKPFFAGSRVPLSGRYVDTESLAMLIIDTALGALDAYGEVELSVQQRKGLFRMYDVAQLRFLGRSREWPTGSPELRIVEWVCEQPEGMGWLDEAIAALFIPETSHTPERDSCRHAHRGLVARRVVEAVNRQVFLFLNVQEYRVVGSFERELLRAGDREVRDAVTCRTRHTSALRVKCREAWAHAVSTRTDTSG